MKKIAIIVLTLIPILISGHIRIKFGWTASFIIDVAVYFLLGLFYARSKAYNSYYLIFLIAASLALPVHTFITGREYWYPYVMPLYLLTGLVSFFSGYLFTLGKKPLALILLISVFIGACTSGKYILNIISLNTFNAPEYHDLIKTKPDLKFFDMNGKIIDDNTFKGKVVVIDFWFIQCSACIDKMGSFEYLSGLYNKNPNIVFISVFNNKINSLKSVKDFLKAKNLNLHYLAYDKDAEFERKYNIGRSGFPVELRIDKQGVLTQVVTAFVGHDLYIKISKENIDNLLRK